MSICPVAFPLSYPASHGDTAIDGKALRVLFYIDFMAAEPLETVADTEGQSGAAYKGSLDVGLEIHAQIHVQTY